MHPTPEIKKKHLKQIGEISAMLLEHGLKSHLSDVGPEMLEFTVQTTRPLTQVVSALYMRDGVERVLVQTGNKGRGLKFIQICLESWD